MSRLKDQHKYFVHLSSAGALLLLLLIALFVWMIPAFSEITRSTELILPIPSSTTATTSTTAATATALTVATESTTSTAPSKPSKSTSLISTIHRFVKRVFSTRSNTDTVDRGAVQSTQYSNQSVRGKSVQRSDNSTGKTAADPRSITPHSFRLPIKSVAFYYGDSFRVNDWRSYDLVVVEAGHVPQRLIHSFKPGQLAAYVSVGEVNPQRPYAHVIQPAWVLGRNHDWKTQIMNLADANYRQFLLNDVIAPLWREGYRALFLDTLDSYRRYVKTPEAVQAQQAGLIALIKTLHQRYPGIQLILNRGFEILPQVHQWVRAVAAESLFAGWNQATGRYFKTTPAEQQWLIKQLNIVKSYKLTPIVIDYLPSDQRQQAQGLLEKIKQLGYVGWVTNEQVTQTQVQTQAEAQTQLQTQAQTRQQQTEAQSQTETLLQAGGMQTQAQTQTGSRAGTQSIPRKIIIVYNSRLPHDVMNSESLRYGAMPLEQLGYLPRFYQATDPLPSGNLKGQYSGVIVWLSHMLKPTQATTLEHWLTAQIQNHVPVLVMSAFNFVLGKHLPPVWHLQFEQRRLPPKHVHWIYTAPLIGFEIKPYVHNSNFVGIRAKQGRILAKLKTSDGMIGDMAAIMPWGGYVLAPLVVESLPEDQARWVVNPFKLYQNVLRLRPIPVPDLTTENGRRLLIAHIDGDGFVSRSEWPGTPLAGQSMKEEILDKYRIPTAVSIIEGELSEQGLYPSLSKPAEAIARDIFKLPWVEIASHSFSHPYKWLAIEHGEKPEKGEFYNMPIKGYTFSLKKEITDSIEYINQRLAPPNKRCRIFLWTGDTNPSPNALAMAYADGVLSMNGGDTVINNNTRSLTQIAPLGVNKGPYYQVFAPNQNENIYTKDWRGPYYGFRRAVETYKLTEKPFRYKPIDIYYHFYSAAKWASLHALKQVYDWALKQPILPLYTSQYIRKVLDNNYTTLAKHGNDWLIHNNGLLREIRVPRTWGYIDLARSRNVIGYWPHGAYQYIHLGRGKQSRLAFTTKKPTQPYLAQANGLLTAYHNTPQGFDITLTSYQPLQVVLANMGSCVLRHKAQRVEPRAVHYGLSYFTFKEQGRYELQLRCKSEKS